MTKEQYAAFQKRSQMSYELETGHWCVRRNKSRISMLEECFLEKVNKKTGLEKEYWNFYELMDEWKLISDEIISIVGDDPHNYFNWNKDQTVHKTDGTILKLNLIDRLELFKKLFEQQNTVLNKIYDLAN